MGIIVRLSANKGPFSVGIRFMTWCDYSHVDFLLRDGTYLGAIPFPGVCVHGMTYSTEAFYRYECDEETSQKIIDFANSQIGKHYDYSGIVGFAARRDWQEEDSWFCSELIASAFNKSNVKIFDENAFKISPRDIAVNPLFKQIDKPNYAR